MNTFIIRKIHALFMATLILNDTDAIKLKYMLEIIINDLLKLTMMFFMFNLFGKAVSFMYCLITVSLIRTFTGGLHFKTFFGCLIFSSCFFSICICFINNVTITLPLLISLYFFIFVTIIFLAPITPSQRPRFSAQKKFQFKLVGVIIVVFHFLLYLTINKNSYFVHSTWVLLFQSIQLLIAYGGIKYEHIKTKINNTTKNAM